MSFLKESFELSKISDSVLYFPSIEFASDEWVKSSLLFWDIIYRIVPKDYEPNDSEIVQEAINCGLIKNISLEKKDLSKTADQFLKFCDKLPFIPAGLEKKTEKIHIDKIDKRLYPELEKISNKFDDEFLFLSKGLARGYMFYLSKIVAERRNLVRATDNRDSWTISPYFIEEGNFGEDIYNMGAEGFYSSLIIKDLFPANISEINITSIIKFVDEQKELKSNFRKKLYEFTESLADCQSEEFARTLIDKFENEIETSKKELKDGMDFFNVDTQTSLFTMGVPVSLTAFGAFAVSGNPFSLYNIFGSILIGAVAAYSDYSKVKKQRTSSYASYLIDMDKELIGKKKYPDYSYIFNEFVND